MGDTRIKGGEREEVKRGMEGGERDGGETEG